MKPSLHPVGDRVVVVRERGLLCGAMCWCSFPWSRGKKGANYTSTGATSAWKHIPGKQSRLRLQARETKVESRHDGPGHASSGGACVRRHGGEGGGSGGGNRSDRHPHAQFSPSFRTFGILPRFVLPHCI